MVFKPGNNANPTGRPPGNQSFVDRAKFLMEKHTIESIIEYVDDESKFRKLSVYDGLIMRRIAEAVSMGGGKSMNSLLDRILGKPAQYIEQKIDQTITVSHEERKKVAEEEADEMHRVAALKIKKPQQPAVH